MTGSQGGAHGVAESDPQPREDAARFDSTVCLDGAARATISVAWIYNKVSKQSYFVLALVDLVPDEIPLIDVTPKWHARLGNDSDWTLYSESQEVPSAEAVGWYEKLVHAGSWDPPWRNLTAPVALSPMLNEPSWPHVVMLHKARAVPFASSRGAGCRMHLLLSETPTLPALSEDEFTRVDEALAKKLNVDLSKTPELRQSACFFQPLPYLRHIYTRLEPSESGQEAVQVTVTPRRGVPLNAFLVDILEQRPTGLRLLSRFRPTTPFYRVPSKERIEQIIVRVYHDRFGLLLQEGPHAFVRSIGMEMNIITRERRVQLPDRKGRAAKLERIPVVGMDRPMRIGSDPERSATRMLYRINQKLETAAQSNDRQMWFNGDAARAEEVLKKILSSAKRRAMVIDPYFGANEVRVWLPSIAKHEAVVQVLTSRYGLQHRSIAGSILKGNDLEQANLEFLAKELEDAAKAGLLNATTVRVMRGSLPAVHDRFIVADNRVWLLGSSLNEFGTRGTMLVELPQPGEVLPSLESVWDSESDSIADRLAALAKAEE